MFKIRQIEIVGLPNSLAGDLSRKGCGQHDFAVELNVQGRPDIERAAVEGLERQSIVGAVIFDLAAEGYFRRHPKSKRGCGSDLRSGLPIYSARLSDLGRIDEVDCGEDMIGNDFGVGDDPKLTAEIGCVCARFAIDALPLRLRGDGEADWRA